MTAEGGNVEPRRGPRVRLVEPDEAREGLRDEFERFVTERGKVPNLFRAAAHRPALAASLAAHLRAVMSEGTVDPLLKELLAIRVSQLNECRY